MSDPTVVAILALGAIVFAVIILVLFKYRKKYGSVKIVDEDKIEAEPECLCPQCHRVMIEAYVLFLYGLDWWIPNNKKPHKLQVSHLHNTLPRANTVLPMDERINVPTNLAWNCPECKLLLMDYDKQVRASRKKVIKSV